MKANIFNKPKKVQNLDKGDFFLYKRNLCVALDDLMGEEFKFFNFHINEGITIYEHQYKFDSFREKVTHARQIDIYYSV